jgi:hypothetical protein
MSDDVTHSPLPWRVEVHPANDVTYILARDASFEQGLSEGFVQPIYGGGVNAEFIVRAVNAHEELLAALKAARGMGCDSCDEWRCAICRQIDAAIATAEGR